MRPVTDRFLAAINSSVVRRLGEVTATPPGATEPTTLGWTDATVTMDSSGARYSASVTLDPKQGTDIYGLVSTPGTEFRIRAGVRYGFNDEEWVDLGVYEATAGSSPLQVGAIPLTLTDGTARLGRCRFPAPYLAAAGLRSDAISAMVTGASPGVTVVVNADGGTMSAGLFDRDRLDAIAQITSDGNLSVGFDAVGEYVIDPAPVLQVTAPVWVTRTGGVGNILDATRNQPFDRLYNTVVAVPVDDLQTWSAVTVSLTDTAHPRHPDKIGVVPFFYTSPMITNATQAAAAARATLQRLLTSTETISVTALGNPALEYGDTITVAHSATETDPGLTAVYLMDGFTFDLKTGSQDLNLRSTDQADLEES